MPGTDPGLTESLRTKIPQNPLASRPTSSLGITDVMPCPPFIWPLGSDSCRHTCSEHILTRLNHLPAILESLRMNCLYFKSQFLSILKSPVLSLVRQTQNQLPGNLIQEVHKTSLRNLLRYWFMINSTRLDM